MDKEAPYLDVPRGWVRLRLLNASLARAYDLRLDNGTRHVACCEDLGFYHKVKRLILSFLRRVNVQKC